jgi:hypothetical protein
VRCLSLYVLYRKGERKITISREQCSLVVKKFSDSSPRTQKFSIVAYLSLNQFNPVLILATIFLHIILKLSSYAILQLDLFLK